MPPTLTRKATDLCPGYVIDPIKGLKHGGADKLWQTVQDAKAEGGRRRQRLACSRFFSLRRFRSRLNRAVIDTVPAVSFGLIECRVRSCHQIVYRALAGS